jgi:hypothetical protein
MKPWRADLRARQAIRSRDPVRLDSVELDDVVTRGATANMLMRRNRAEREAAARPHPGNASTPYDRKFVRS